MSVCSLIAALVDRKVPREQRQAQIDGRGIERVDGLLEVDAKRFVEVEPTRDPDQVLGKLGIDTPVARFVGIGQRAAGYVLRRPK